MPKVFGVLAMLTPVTWGVYQYGHTTELLFRSLIHPPAPISTPVPQREADEFLKDVFDAADYARKGERAKGYDYLIHHRDWIEERLKEGDADAPALIFLYDRAILTFREKYGSEL
jgi:hypothetical protein